MLDGSATHLFVKDLNNTKMNIYIYIYLITIRPKRERGRKRDEFTKPKWIID